MPLPSSGNGGSVVYHPPSPSFSQPVGVVVQRLFWSESTTDLHTLHNLNCVLAITISIILQKVRLNCLLRNSHLVELDAGADPHLSRSLSNAHLL